MAITAKSILNRLIEGEEKVKYAPNQNIVLVLGNAGSGKSTYVQYLAGNNDNLISEPVKNRKGRPTGNYIIVDRSDRVGNSTINSHTEYPEQVVHPKTGTIIYDCPGFSGTRDAEHDITGAYFIKRVADSAKAVKFVFTINYCSVKMGADKQDFMLFAKHATKFIKDITKFKDGIALVATKVNEDKFYDQVIAGIATYLEVVRDELKQNSKPSIFEQDVIKFLDVLLEGQDYPKIGFIKQPKQPGPFSKITGIQNQKKKLEKLLFENIHFITHNQKDFGYTISAESQNYVQGLAEEINKNIVSEIVNIGQEIKDHYQNEEKQLQDIEDLYGKLKSGHDSLLETSKNCLEVFEFQGFIKQILRNAKDLNVRLSSKNVLSLFTYDKTLTFLKAISGQSTAKPSDWSQALSNVIEYLNHSQQWYNFLINLYTGLSKYDIQRDISQYSDVTRELKYQIGKNGNNEAETRNILKRFLYQVFKQDSLRKYNNIKNINLDKFKLKFLDQVLDLTLKYEVITACQKPNKLVVQGQNVKLSDIALKSCPEPIKCIEVHALNKVFVDVSLNKTGNNTQISIIAPTWDIVGTHKIILDGMNGQGYPKAKNGIAPGSHGEDGKPGKPGGPAGNFLGIGGIFINGQNLIISANGGKGGQGQEGGDGADGKDGEDPVYVKKKFGPFSSCSKIIPEMFPGFKVETTELTKAQPAIVDHMGTNVTVYGTSGEKGGNAGRGGGGGRGAHPGKVTVIALAEDSRVQNSTKEGLNGEAGNHGKKGSGGRNGEIIHFITPFEIHPPAIYYEYCELNKNTLQRREMGRAPSGNQENSYNEAGIQTTEVGVQILNPSQSVNWYKKYLRENLNDNIRESTLKNFLKQLENNQSVKSSYDTLGLVDEFQCLESQYYELHKKIPLLPFYKYLLDMISTYAETRKDYEKSDEYRKILAYLYISTLSKICDINNNSQNHLVIDIKSYLSSISQDIDRLKDSINALEKNKVKDAYKKTIDKQIQEANQFIEQDISKEIKDLTNQTDKTIKLLIDEVDAHEAVAKKEKEKILKQRKQLENQLVFRKFLEVIQVASQVLAFAGPVGATAGAAIGGASLVAQTFAFGGEAGQQGAYEITALPQSISHYVTIIEDLYKSKQEFLKKELDNANQQLEAQIKNEPNDDSLKEIGEKISELMKRIETGNSNHSSISPFPETGELNELLKKQVTELEKSETSSDREIENKLKICTRLQLAINGGEKLLGVYSRIQKEQEKIDKLGGTLKQVNDKISKLEQYEESIYKIMMPTIRSVQARTTALAESLEGKSHVVLDVSKWKIQSAIKDVKLQILQMTKGYKSQEKLTRCLEKLEYGMSALIQVYDRMQDFYDNLKLAEYISEISTKRAKSIEIENIELRNVFHDLEQITQSNLVLGEYSKFVNAFKLFVFPFADTYLGKFNLTLDLQQENNKGNLVPSVTEKIKSLERMLSKEDAVINPLQDKNMFTGVVFNSNGNITAPFFTWKHGTNEELISQLLQGREITIKADISKGIDKSAIKFNEIGVRFKLRSKTMQDGLNRLLEPLLLEMTHLGTSYYRCGKKVYVMTHDKEVIVHSLSKNRNGEYYKQNKVYTKIKGNIPILSPYTMWKIRLRADNSNSFGRLAKYRSQAMDLELEGRGQYLDHGIDHQLCSEDVDKYYKAVDDVYESNNTGISYEQYLGETEGDIWPENESHPEEVMGNYRERRDITHQDGTESLFATSGTWSNIKFSFVSNILNLIGNSLIPFNVITPLNTIKQWFIKDGSHFKQDNSVSVSSLLNVHPLIMEVPKINNSCIDYETSSTSNIINYNTCDLQRSLLLFDLFLRRTHGMEYKQKELIGNNYKCSPHAQDLAYRAYVSQDL